MRAHGGYCNNCSIYYLNALYYGCTIPSNRLALKGNDEGTAVQLAEQRGGLGEILFFIYLFILYKSNLSCYTYYCMSGFWDERLHIQLLPYSCWALAVCAPRTGSFSPN